MFDLIKLEIPASDLVSFASNEETILASVAIENGKFYLYGWSKDLTGKKYMKKIYPAEKIDNIISNFLVLKGSILLTFSLVSGEKLYLFLEIPKNHSNLLPYLAKNAMNDINSLKLEKIERNNVMSWMDGIIPQSKFLHIKTKWKMSVNDVKDSVMGILSNRMVFTPKVFCSEWSPIVGVVLDHEVHGRSEYTVVTKSDNKFVIEFNAYSKWFKDFFKNVLARNVGPFIYWGRSDGKETLINNFIIFSESEPDFLGGLRNHWLEETRKKHKNSIIKISRFNYLDFI